MATTIDWATKIITVPKADTTLVQSSPIEIRELDLNTFRISLKDLEDDVEGAPFLDTHTHNTEVVLGGVVYARVIEIINGYTVTFEDGAYALNLVGANSNVGDVINFNQVSVRSSNSAGLISSQTIDSLDYGGYIHYNESNVNGTGESHPVGTSSRPVNNMADLLTIASKYSLVRILAYSNINLDRNIVGFSISGAIPVTFYPSSKKANICSFSDITLDGNFDTSFITARDCNIISASNIYGTINNSFISGNILITANQSLKIADCESGIPGSDSPTIDMNSGNPTAFSCRSYSGGLTIINCDHPDDLSTLSFIGGGKPHLEPSCTDGFISIRGSGDEDDRSAGTTVDYTAWFNPTTAKSTLQLMRANEEKNIQTNKYYKRDEDTGAVILEKDYNIDGNNNETLTKP